MQLWLAHSADISLQEQLTSQIMLGILSQELLPGQRLPSTRALARRHRLHANTVSAGYRQLEKTGWLEMRRGSGVYVSLHAPNMSSPDGLQLDSLIANLFRTARQQRFPLPQIQHRLRQWLNWRPPDHFLLLEPDPELRRIAHQEIASAADWPVESRGLPGGSGAERKLPAHKFSGAIMIALPSKARRVQKLLPASAELYIPRLRSAPEALAHWLPARPEVLLAIASRWPDFVRWARTLLVAAGYSPRAMLLRDARQPGWRRGLDQAAAVICDSLLAAQLRLKIPVLAFPLLSDAAREELRQLAEFHNNPRLETPNSMPL